MKKMLIFLGLMLFGTALISCKSRIESEADFYKWINNPDNGLVESKEINDLKITVKYLPAEFLAYKEVKSLGTSDQKVIDSIVNYYKNSYAFLMTIKPDYKRGANGDIMYKDLTSYQEYKQRASQLNFNLDNYVSLHTEKAAYKPVLSTLENTYSAVDQRNIYLVFSANEKQSDLLDATKLDFTFEDELFGSGISHFVFAKQDFNNLPSILYSGSPR